MSDEPTERDVEALLATHAWAGTQGPSTDEHPLGRLARCACGWTEDYDLDPFGPWRAHVAEALAPAFAQARREGAAEALEDAVDRWQFKDWSNVLLPKPAPPAVPVIAYSNSVLDWLRERVDAIRGDA